MPDNVAITAGSGTDIATDLISAVHYQRVKVDWGPDGTATDTDATGTAALPVTQIGTSTNASGQVTVTNTSTTVVSADTDRRGVLITNYQTVAIFLDPNGGSATTSNRRVDPGASVYYPVTTAVTGCTSAAYTASGDAKVHYDTFAR